MQIPVLYVLRYVHQVVFLDAYGPLGLGPGLGPGPRGRVGRAGRAGGVAWAGEWSVGRIGRVERTSTGPGLRKDAT